MVLLRLRIWRKKAAFIYHFGLLSLKEVIVDEPSRSRPLRLRKGLFATDALFHLIALHLQSPHMGGTELPVRSARSSLIGNAAHRYVMQVSRQFYGQSDSLVPKSDVGNLTAYGIRANPL